MLLPPVGECADQYVAVYSGGGTYLSTPMGSAEGVRRYELGQDVFSDFTEALSMQSVFGMAIKGISFNGPQGYTIASIPGWSKGGVDLIVTWREPTPAETESWSSVKVKY